MDNTTVTSFTMTAFDGIGRYKFILWIVFFLLFIVTLFLNLLLMAVIYFFKDLHQPMYLFVFNLALNGIYGSTSLLPAILTLLLSETHEIPVPWCLVQVYFLHTYAAVEFLVLAVMGYDRYIAICYPLQYHNILSMSKTWKLIALIWVYPSIVLAVYLSFTMQLQFCDNKIEKMYCINLEVARNSCTSIAHISIMGLSIVLLLIIPQILMIVFSYVKIFRVCLNLSKDSQVKAFKTCGPHILSVVNYSVGCLFEMGQSRFDMSFVPFEARIFVSLYFALITPILNPALYGIGTQVIRVSVWKLFSNTKSRITTM